MVPGDTGVPVPISGPALSSEQLSLCRERSDKEKGMESNPHSCLGEAGAEEVGKVLFVWIGFLNPFGHKAGSLLCW